MLLKFIENDLQTNFGIGEKTGYSSEEDTISKKIKRERLRKSQPIINKISEIRKMNNECWMALLSLAFSENPKEAKKIFKSITKNDKKINELSKKLCK